MGIEVWAFTALIVILAVYLLPFLVRRREMTGRANVQDRYSAELRVLATGAAAPERDGTCESSGHAELFRRRPKVRAMNRPAVRNVRALRAERELIHVRKTHAQARERRRVAASHRAVVACALLGVALGAWVLGLLTALPWWPALVPTALLGASMAAGRRAAMASAAADKRERRRIAELERELMGLTGRRPAVPVVASSRAEGAPPERAGAVESASSAESAAGADGATVSSVRASLPEILQELRAKNAERERARAGAVQAAREEAAGTAGREDRAQGGEQRTAERRAAERGEPQPRRSQEERRERAEAAQRVESTRSAEPVEAAGPAGGAASVETAASAGGPERAGGDSEFHSAVGSFEAVSPAWSQIVPDSELDGAIESASSAERSGPRHSTASSSAASRLTASPATSGSSASSASTAGRRREEPSTGASQRQAAPAASGEGRWSLSAESAESVAARAAARTRTEDEERARPSAEDRLSGRSADEARGSTSGSGTARRSIKKEALAAFPDKSVVKEPTTSTPPQGWRPIKVPAPTYTLAARAPKRVFADPVVDEGASAPVPARPQAVRSFTAPDFTEQDFHPIDLDAILERRRAAGE